MYCRRRNAPRAQRGVALVVALLVFATCSALLVALQRDFTLSFQRGSNRLLADQLWQYLLGAEQLGVLALRLDVDADEARNARRDDLTELWAEEAAPYALDEGGWLAGSLSDLQGRFNLNSLDVPPPDTPSAPRFSAAQQLFIRLLQTLEATPLTEYEAIAITESIGDWLDADEEPRLNGAEAPFYSARTPAYRPANRPMRSVSELRAVANVTPELYAQLEPLVTVWPQLPATLNVHTAPVALLRALNSDGNLQPLSAADGEALLRWRQERGFADIADLLAQPVFADGPFDELLPLLGESSGYFLLSARAAIADREQRLYSVLRREARQVSVLARVRGAL